MPDRICFPDWDALPDFGLYMDQMLLFTQRLIPAELTAGMVNSYVKAGIMDRPKGKKYSRAALAQLLMIVSLKAVLPLDGLRRLLHPVRNTESTEEIYESFLNAQRGLKDFQESRQDVTAMELCVEAAGCQALCRQKLEEEKEGREG